MGGGEVSVWTFSRASGAVIAADLPRAGVVDLLGLELVAWDSPPCWWCLLCEPSSTTVGWCAGTA
jgi:hypothetical protein